jgi:hypothetical protein
MRHAAVSALTVLWQRASQIDATWVYRALDGTYELFRYYYGLEWKRLIYTPCSEKTLKGERRVQLYDSSPNSRTRSASLLAMF